MPDQRLVVTSDKRRCCAVPNDAAASEYAVQHDKRRTRLRTPSAITRHFVSNLLLSGVGAGGETRPQCQTGRGHSTAELVDTTSSISRLRVTSTGLGQVDRVPQRRGLGSAWWPVRVVQAVRVPSQAGGCERGVPDSASAVTAVGTSVVRRGICGGIRPTTLRVHPARRGVPDPGPRQRPVGGAFQPAANRGVRRDRRRPYPGRQAPFGCHGCTGSGPPCGRR